VVISKTVKITPFDIFSVIFYTVYGRKSCFVIIYVELTKCKELKYLLRFMEVYCVNLK